MLSTKEAMLFLLSRKLKAEENLLKEVRMEGVVVVVVGCSREEKATALGRGGWFER